MKSVVFVSVLSLALAGAARAEESGEKASVLEEARQHVARAKVHYDLGEFKEAADEYIIVYRLRPIPALLFNIAQAYRQGGMYEKARQFYKSYLRESPDAKNKEMIEQAIHELDEMLARDRRTKEAAPTGVKEPPETLPPPAAAKAEPPPLPVAPVKAQPAAERPPPVVAMATPRPAAPPWATTAAPASAPAVAEDDPLYKKWWLWTAVGVVAAGAGVAAMTMGGNAPPQSHFGTTPVFP